MNNFKKKYTDKQNNEIIKLFTRGLREGEIIVDNRDTTIAKETGLPVHHVSYIIIKYLDSKIDKINEYNK